MNRDPVHAGALAARPKRGPLRWMLEARVSSTILRPGLPADALDTVCRALVGQGYALVAEVQAAQAASYRQAAGRERQIRLEPARRPARADQVHSITIRHGADDTLRVTVGFGPRTVQAVGTVIAGATLAVVASLWAGGFPEIAALLYYPLAIGLMCMIMPSNTNGDAARAIAARVSDALDAENARAAESVRRRVEAPGGPRVAVEPGADAGDDGSAGATGTRQRAQ